MTKKVITNNIRMLRFMHNEMTQKQLGDAIGVTRQTIMAIESNKYSASLEVAYKIVEVFNVPFEDVFQYVAIDE